VNPAPTRAGEVNSGSGKEKKEGGVNPAPTSLGGAGGGGAGFAFVAFFAVLLDFDEQGFALFGDLSQLGFAGDALGAEEVQLVVEGLEGVDEVGVFFAVCHDSL